MMYTGKVALTKTASGYMSTIEVHVNAISFGAAEIAINDHIRNESFLWRQDPRIESIIINRYDRIAK